MPMWILLFCLTAPLAPTLRAEEPDLTLAREGNLLVVHAPHVPGGGVRVNYIEAYCRPDSTDADWVGHTKIPHTHRVVSAPADGRQLVLEDTLSDGVVVTHDIRVVRDAVRFLVTATNPTATASAVLWAQPCVRLGPFTGYEPPAGPNLDDYLPKCFVLVDGRITRLPLTPWATAARYTPGQVWGAPDARPQDLNPRPHSPLRLRHGLIGAFSADEVWICATAWEPWQELFQGVARCLHSDFRLGPLAPGEARTVRGVLYLMPNDPAALLARYRREFPSHHPRPERAIPAPVTPP
jgi:hypothetical protein